MQRKQYIKPIAIPKPLFFENLLAGVTVGGKGDHMTDDTDGENGDPVGNPARSRYDVDWFGTDNNSSFDF